MSHTFVDLIYRTIQRANPTWYERNKEKVTAVWEEALQAENVSLTRQDVNQILGEIFSPEETLIYFVESEMLRKIPEFSELTQKEMYVIVASILEKMKGY